MDFGNKLHSHNAALSIKWCFGTSFLGIRGSMIISQYMHSIIIFFLNVSSIY